MFCQTVDCADFTSDKVGPTRPVTIDSVHPLMALPAETSPHFTASVLNGKPTRARSGGRRVISPPPLERIVEHEGRLEILCHLIDNGPLTMAQLSVRTDTPLTAIRYHVTLLSSVRLTKKTGDPVVSQGP